MAAASVTLSTAGDSWTTVYDALVAVMRTLIKNLEGKLAKDDPRWLAFGLNMPATVTTPGKPQGLTATTDDTGAIVVQCTAVPLAARYRWRMRRVGLETDYVLAGRSVDPIATITAVMPGQTVELIVQAVNGNAQSVASDALLFTVPMVAKGTKAAISAAPASETDEVTPSSNGHRNGNGIHARVA